jgi:hypothetical protein
VYNLFCLSLCFPFLIRFGDSKFIYERLFPLECRGRYKWGIDFLCGRFNVVREYAQDEGKVHGAFPDATTLKLIVEKMFEEAPNPQNLPLYERVVSLFDRELNP